MQVTIKEVSKSTARIMELILLRKVVGIPGCIQLLDFLEDDYTCYYIMERPEKYIDLFNLIDDKGTLSEEESRRYFRQMVIATMACHEAKVLHGDLKEENMVIDLKDDTIKLIDFGGGALFRDGEYTEFLGTSLYAPPEWHKYRNYHAVPATVWSLGITLFSIASEDIPFQNIEEICSGELRFPDGLSTSFRDLLGSMLSIDPDKRPQLDKILQHQWLKESDDGD